MSEDRAVYFMKLNDLYLYDEEIDEKILNQKWIDLFISVVSYVSIGCFSRIHKNSKLILYIVKDTGDIEDHPNKLPMEFVSYYDIPPENIFLINHMFDNIEVNKKTLPKEIYHNVALGTKINMVKMNYMIDLLIDAYTYLDTNGLLDQDFYTHITCSIFFNNIRENGLLVNPPVRIIDYDSDDDDEEEEFGRRKGKKSKKKERYDLTQEIHSLSDFTDSQKFIIPIVHGNELVFDEEDEEEDYQGNEGNQGYDEEEELFPASDFQPGGPHYEEEEFYQGNPGYDEEDRGNLMDQEEYFFNDNKHPQYYERKYPNKDVLDGDDDEFNEFIDQSARMDDDDDGEEFFTSFVSRRRGGRKTYKRKTYKRKTYKRKNK